MFKFLCVGNITERKNQRMLVDAYRLLSDSIKDEIDITFIGSNENTLRKYITDEECKNLLVTGSLPRNEVYNYMKKSNCIITAALDEGFGLPIIEGYTFGLPAVFSGTIDSLSDIYHPKTAIVVNDYTATSFAEAIDKAIKKEWDNVFIRNFAKKFDINNCAKSYLSVFFQAISFGKSQMNRDDFDKIFDECIKATK